MENSRAKIKKLISMMATTSGCISSINGYFTFICEVLLGELVDIVLRRGQH